MNDMNYFNIMNLIDAGRKSLEEENYWSAISVALSLPGICSRIEFANKEGYRNFKWVDKKDHDKGKVYTSWKDRKCYIDFCREAIRDKWVEAVLGNNFPEVLYSFRCDFVHDGIANILDNDPVDDDSDKEIFLMLGGQSLEYSEYRIIDIGLLCKKILDSISFWYAIKNPSEIKHTLVLDIKNNDDDRKMYKKLSEGMDDDCSELYAEIERRRKERKNNG